MNTNKNFLKVEELIELAVEFEQESADYCRPFFCKEFHLCPPFQYIPPKEVQLNGCYGL